jgi:hypothetical protein
MLGAGRGGVSTRNDTHSVHCELPVQRAPVMKGDEAVVGTTITLAIPAKQARFSLTLGRLLPHDMGIAT